MGGGVLYLSREIQRAREHSPAFQEFVVEKEDGELLNGYKTCGGGEKVLEVDNKRVAVWCCGWA